LAKVHATVIAVELYSKNALYVKQGDKYLHFDPRKHIKTEEDLSLSLYLKAGDSKKFEQTILKASDLLISNVKSGFLEINKYLPKEFEKKENYKSETGFIDKALDFLDKKTARLECQRN